MSLRIVDAAISTERADELHQARLMLLLRHTADRGDGSVEGITKLAKLDFLVRYPLYLERLFSHLNKTRTRPLRVKRKPYEENTVESKMIRFRYEPWDERYRRWIALLVAKGLANTYLKGRTVHVRLTDAGKSIAARLAADPAFEDLDERSRLVQISRITIRRVVEVDHISSRSRTKRHGVGSGYSAMKLRLLKLLITFRRSQETIEFADFNYFYGEMGAGKSSIARLIDYCLGAKRLVMTPALQSEFVAVALTMQLNGKPLEIERGRESSQVVAKWDDQQIQVPARDAEDIVIPGTEGEVLSDLLFHIQGQSPPRVRRSQLNEDSDLERLSLRDLLFYCYLDQDSMDSSFFYLDREAENFRRLKSRNVLRTILGVHQERVAELELRLDEVRRERSRFSESADLLTTTMEETGIASEVDANARITRLRQRLEQIEKRSDDVRRRKQHLQGHAADRLRTRARQLTDELEASAVTLDELGHSQDDDTRHLNAILALSTKIKRLESARAVLNGVSFERCPRCTQVLPVREKADCPVCGQPDSDAVTGAPPAEAAAVEADMDSRINELQGVLEAQAVQMRRIKRREGDLQKAKETVDTDLVDVMKRYDSAFLAEALSLERERAQAQEEIRYVEKLKALPTRVEGLRQKATAAAAEEGTIREQLRSLRAAAEKDLGNLNKLKKLFLDCLVRAKISGFALEDVVNMKQPWCLPEILGSQSGDLAVSSFSTLGSGGKKNLFKCCFALALHRLATELNTLLPSLLVIDSPMKNISERENRPQFEGFHQLLYELATTELQGTQFVLIDKEFCPPPMDMAIDLRARHMRVNSSSDPPLCPYYRDRGHTDDVPPAVQDNA